MQQIKSSDLFSLLLSRFEDDFFIAINAIIEAKLNSYLKVSQEKLSIQPKKALIDKINNILLETFIKNFIEISDLINKEEMKNDMIAKLKDIIESK